MKIAGIIAEYNPLHNGHIYHIDQTKKETNADYIIVLMSGTFTQAGNISLFDKFKKASIACSYGADLVLELPTIFSTASSNEFAYGAVNILNKLNIIDYLSFGVETKDIEILKNISKKIILYENDIEKGIKDFSKKGFSYAISRDEALKYFLSDEELDVIKKSNNILAIEYLNSLNKLDSNIIPIAIERKGKTINDLSINSSLYISATAIRESVLNNNLECIKEYVPELTYKHLDKICLNKDFFNILKYKIINIGKEGLVKIYGVKEGLENKIISAISVSSSYIEFIQIIKSKRYQLTRIKRILINILLDITYDKHDKLINSSDSLYAHVLAMSKRGKDLLSIISKNSNIALITSLNTKILNSCKNDLKENLELDIFATNVQSVILNEELNKDYTNKI